MSEWMLIITIVWGDPALGGEGKYVGGPFPAVQACAAAVPPADKMPKLAVGDGQSRVIKAECVLRDSLASH